MTIATVRQNSATGKFEAIFNGSVLARSGDKAYFEYHLAKGDVPKLRDAGITGFVFENDGVPTASKTVTAAAVAQVANTPEFSVGERFELLEELIAMTIKGDASKALCIGGKGGIGKSFSVLQGLKKAGLKDTENAISAYVNENSSADDTDEEKADLARSVTNLGDYKIIKGYSTAAALYETLYLNRDKVVIFDDCDSVLRDTSAVNVLKAALDTYEERWVSWNAKNSDLPPSFLFTGKVMFITNMDMDQVPEAIRTRCFNVNLAMSPLQRIERMRGTLEAVLPDVSMEEKTEAIDLLEEYAHVSKNINYRQLMKTISIRISGTKDWTRLALFNLIEN